MKTRLLILLAAIGTLAASPAWAGRAGLMAIGEMYAPSYNVATNTSTNFNVGVGGFYAHPLMDKLELESGLYFFRRSVNFDTTVPGILVHFHPQAHSHIQIPIMARYWLMDYLNAGLGVYGAFMVSKVHQNFTIDASVPAAAGGGTTVDRDVTFAEAGLKNFDWGFLGSIQGAYPLTQQISILANINFNMAMNNIWTLTADGNVKPRDIQFMVGASYNLSK